MTDTEIQRVLSFWFDSRAQDTLKLDSRMDRWFGANAELDEQIQQEFGDLVEKASHGELMDWVETPHGRLALIILLDQFRRNIYRGTADAYARDKLVLKICIEGTKQGDFKHLTAEERIFFFMPLQHSESPKVQEQSVQVFNAMAERVSDTMKETFLTTAHFAELHRDIIAEFGRFPHRNEVLGRENTESEEKYLNSDAPNFGQEELAGEEN